MCRFFRIFHTLWELEEFEEQILKVFEGGGKPAQFRTGGRRVNPRYKSDQVSDNSSQVKVADWAKVSQVEKVEKLVTKRSEQDAEWNPTSMHA